jgi:hypothetical protein
LRTCVFCWEIIFTTSRTNCFCTNFVFCRSLEFFSNATKVPGVDFYYYNSLIHFGIFLPFYLTANICLKISKWQIWKNLLGFQFPNLHLILLHPKGISSKCTMQFLELLAPAGYMLTLFNNYNHFIINFLLIVI